MLWGRKRPQKQKDLTFWLQGPISGDAKHHCLLDPNLYVVFWALYLGAAQLWHYYVKLLNSSKGWESRLRRQQRLAPPRLQQTMAQNR